MLQIETKMNNDKTCDMEVIEDGVWIESASNISEEDIRRLRRHFLIKYFKGK